MRIDMQEIKITNKKKIVLILIIVLLIISLSIYSAVIFAKKYNENKIGKKQEEVQNIVTNEIQNIEEKSTTYIPKLTKEGKDNIKNIYSSDKKIVYLTFDDGPSKSVTPLILDVLKENNIKATFFVLGKSVKNNPDLVKRAYEEGHFIANHGYSHVYSSIYKNVNNVIQEYNRTEEEIKKAIGISEYSSHLFRFPGGSVGGKYHDIKQKAIKELDKKDIAYLDWNALTRDAEGKFTKEELLKNLRGTVKKKNSIVILSHDATNKILTYEILQDEINYLKKSGYEFGDMRNIIK